MSRPKHASGRNDMEGPPPTLAQILEGYIKAHGDIARDRDEIELALGDVDEIVEFADGCGAEIGRADAERMSQAGLIWVRDANEEGADIGRIRDEATATLAD